MLPSPIECVQVKLLASVKILISIEMMELHLGVALEDERAVKCGSWLFLIHL